VDQIVCGMRICTGNCKAIRTRNRIACRSYIFLWYRESYTHPYGKLFMCRRPHCLKLILSLIGTVTVTFAVDCASFRFGPFPFRPLSVYAPFRFDQKQIMPLSFMPLSGLTKNLLWLFPFCLFPFCPFPFLPLSVSAPFRFGPFPK
jgi:hypothetical protein